MRSLVCPQPIPGDTLLKTLCTLTHAFVITNRIYVYRETIFHSSALRAECQHKIASLSKFQYVPLTIHMKFIALGLDMKKSLVASSRDANAKAFWQALAVATS